MDSDKLVIVGFGDALSAPEVAFSLLDAGFHVAAFVRRNSKAPAIRKCRNVVLLPVTAPEEDVDRTVEELNGFYSTLKPLAIMPLNDKAVWLCDAMSCDQQVRVAGATGMQARFSLDKRVQTEEAVKAGFNVPKTTVIESRDDASSFNRFPLVAKPALAVARSGNCLLEKKSVSYCADRREFDRVIKSWNWSQPLMVQAVHEGVGGGLFGFAAEDRIMALSAHRRVRMMNPKGSGASACQAVPPADYPVRNAEDMLVRMQWRGIFMVEFLRDETGKSWFVELNGRPWGSMALARQMGFEYPAWAVRSAVDPGFLPAPPVHRESVTCRHLGREFVHILQVLRGPGSAAIPNWPSFWRTLATVVRVGRNDRWYNWNPGNRAVFFADTYDTIMNETLRKLRKA